MSIRNNIAHLPTRSPDGSHPPSANPFVAEALAARWEEWYEEQGLKTRDLAIPEAGPYRASMASSRCDRQLYYALLQSANPRPKLDHEVYTDDPEGTDRYFEDYADWEAEFGDSNPSQLSDFWTYWLGQIVHEALGPVITDMFPGTEEDTIDLRKIGIPGSAHADVRLLADIEGDRTLIEIKTINGFGYKMQASKFQGPPTGPKYGGVMQALLSAEAEGIDRVVLVLVSLERVGPNVVSWASDSEASRFLGEWHYTVSEMRSQIDAEKARIHRVLADVDAGELPARELHDPEYPAGAVVQKPLAAKAPWTLTIGGADGPILQDSGTYWGCGYCRFRDRCTLDGA